MRRRAHTIPGRSSTTVDQATNSHDAPVPSERADGGVGFAQLVVREIASSRAAHGPVGSHHEGFAILLEELEEYWAHVRLRPDRRVPAEALEELVQIGAMAQRIAEDLDLATRRNRRVR